MAGFFSVKVAKGVRISASSRGLRTHVGPRGARIHAGGGRTGMSTGAGPFTYYSSLSGSSRSRGAGGPTKTQLAQAEKERQFLELREALSTIMNIHKTGFSPAQHPKVPPITPPDEKALYRKREEELLNGISLFKRAERKASKEKAAELAAADLRSEKARLQQAHDEQQAELDAAWSRLNENDPETVIATIDEAFEDNQAPAAPVDVEGSTLSLVMLVPPESEIPDRMPDLTPSGKPTVKKMTKAIRADTYLTLVCGHLLATTKEALAVAPGISEVKAVAVRRASPDVFGDIRMEVILATSFSRSDLNRVQWDSATSPEIVQQASTELLWETKGKSAELKPLDLDDEPALKTFVDAIAERISS